MPPQLLADAIEAEAKLLIIGDYDCDGATATRRRHARPEDRSAPMSNFLLPDRFKLGYGLSPEIVDVAAAAIARPDHHRRQRHRQPGRRRRAPNSTASPR